MFHYLTSTRVISTITIILNLLVISYKKNIYTGSYLCVFIRVRLTSSISYSLYNIAEYALFTYVIHIYHIPLYNITEYALFTYVIHIYHIPLNNITDFPQCNVPLYKILECSLYMRMQYSRGISEPEDLQVYDTADKRLLDPRKTRLDEYLEFISHNFQRNRKFS